MEIFSRLWYTSFVYCAIYDRWGDKMRGEVLSSKQTLKNYLKVFGIALLLGLAIFAPFLIYDKGLFIYYGDFNVQQIPFYQMCHDAVKNGEFGWNWYTDLGANFIGSYAFYLLGSPFFWLTIPFPSEAVPYLMAPLLILKIGIASVTSYGFIKRFVRNEKYAMIGALLYAFSGYSIYNIFFNHFHEVIAFFPLLLIGMEEFAVNKRRGLFALAVALNAVVNYYFFFGEVIFVLIYFFVRMRYREDFKITFGSFCLLALEAVFGLLMSSVLLIPAIMTVLGNPRMSNFLLGWSGVFYGNVQRYGLILSSMFFPPDIPAYPNLFPDSNAKWSSVSLFLPLFSMTGVFAYFKKGKKHWGKSILLISLLIAFVPLLNSSFSAFNSSYYARWFYMPILLMALLTVKALEECTDQELNFGFRWTLFGVICFSLLGVWPSKEEGAIVFGKLINYPERLAAYLLVAVMGLILFKILIRLRGKQIFFRAAAGATCFVTAVMSILILVLGKGDASVTYKVVELGLHGRDNISYLDSDEDNFYRTDTYCDGDERCMDNLCMFWQVPALQAFQSVVPGSVFTFYDSIGIERSVASRPSIENYSLRALMSAKYLYTYEGDEDAKTEGYTYLDTQGGFDIYENDCYIPIGFTYDYYVSEEEFKNYSKSIRCDVLLSAMVLSPEQIQRHFDILDNLKDQELAITGSSAVKAAVAERRKNCCSSFIRDRNGFTASIETKGEELVFFSIPYEEGWSASVNGTAVEIENVSNGMMAVRVPAGSSEIRFDYETPGLKLGIMVTAGAFLLLLLYLLIVKLVLKEKAVILRRDTTHLLWGAGTKISAETAYVHSVSQWAEQKSAETEEEKSLQGDPSPAEETQEGENQ